MTPRQEAIAFRIWAYATPRGWDCTPTEVASALDLSWQQVSGVASRKGWAQRFRTTSRDHGRPTIQAPHAYQDEVLA